tara:strand:- start:983 stop:1459 length:477 start_codon:yes stop_codon:yes gene_type:complete
MPTFKKDTDGFMGKPSGFKMKHSPNKKTGEGFPFKAMGGIQQYDASPMSKPLVGDQDQLPEHLQKKILDSPMKKRTKGEMKANPDHGFAGQITSPMMKKNDKKVPKIKKKSPHDTVKMLQAKKDAGTITDAELKRLRELQKMMETGPGSYGNEQYDKN